MSLEEIVNENGQENDILKSVENLSPAGLKKAYIELARSKSLLQEKLLKQQQLVNKYSSIIEHTPNAFFITTADGMILEANKSAVEIFGHSLDELKTMGRQGIIDHSEPDIHQHLKTRAELGRVHGEVTGIHKTGKRFKCVFLSFVIPFNEPDAQHITIVEEVYERKVTEQDLDNSERRFQRLIENSDDVIIEINKERIVKYVSPSVKRVMGYDQSEVLGLRLRDLAYTEDISLLASVFEKVLQNPGKTFYRQYRVKHKTKGFIWVEGSAISLFDVPGVESLIINQRDVSVKKQAIDLVIQSGEQYRYLFNYNPLPLFIFDFKKFRILECNDASLHKYGYTRKEFLKLTLKDLLKVDDVSLLVNEFETQFGKKGQYKKTLQHYKKNGELMYVKITINKIKYGQREAALALANDVTQNLIAHNLLLQSYERLETAQEIAHLGYWEHDLATDKLYWSKEVYKIFGLSEDEFKGDYQSFFQRIHPDDQQAYQAQQSRAIRGEIELNAEHRVVRPDGTERVVLEKGWLGYDSKNKPVRFEGTVQDITELKMREQEREQLIRELTMTIQDLQQFSYITSHNLRTPLANLTGLLQLLEGIPIENEMLAQIIDGFKTSTEALNETVNDLLKVLVVKKNTSIAQEPLMMQSLFEKVMMQTKNLLDEISPRMSYDFSLAPTITFSKAYMESILLNLLTNAIKYRSPSRQLKISVTTENAGDKIVLRFSDNGLGLDVERHRARIFGFYQRFHDHPDSKGIGLYLVKSQLEALGGSIEIESEVNVGTQFILTFKNG